MIKLYDFPLSGHAHRVRLMLSLLNIEHELIPVNLVEGEQKQDDYLALNPFGLAPVLDDDGFIVRDSNAILAYLACRYNQQWSPQDAESVARIQEWLAKEASAAPANARLITVFGAPLEPKELIAESHRLLAIMEQQLKHRAWLATDVPSIADVSVYTYIAHAPEGGVSLVDYPSVRAWLTRVEGLSGFIAMEAVAAGLSQS
jgi:glutathione S-transferase